MPRGKLTSQKLAKLRADLREEIKQGTLTRGVQSRYAEKYDISRQRVFQIAKQERDGYQPKYQRPSRLVLVVRSRVRKAGLMPLGWQRSLAGRFRVTPQRVNNIVRDERRRLSEINNP